MAPTNDLKNGMTLNLDGQLWTVQGFPHVTPGKGGAFVRTKLKNILSGKVVDKTFNAGTKVEVASVDKREMQYLYRDGDDYVFMDNTTYDQSHLAPAVLGDAVNFLKESDNAVIQRYGDEVVGVDLPASVELIVSETAPGVQGDRVSGARKPATLETGHVLQVPLFVNQGDKIKVDTRSGDYITRA